MTTERATVKSLASEMSAAFVGATRADGTEYRLLKDDHPEWMQDVCHKAHGDMFPDDWRYRLIEEAVDALADADDPDDITPEADIYTHELTGWLHSRADRYSYCDEAIEEYGIEEFPGTVELLQMGQVYEKREVLAFVRESLQEIVDAQEEDETESE